MDKIDQQYLNELVGGQEPGEEDTQNDLKVHEENTTIEELEVICTPTSLIPHHTFGSLTGWLSHSIVQVRTHCCLWSLQRPFFYSMLVFIYSLFSHSPLTSPYFLPSKVIILICFIYILLFVGGLVKPVVLCMHVFFGFFEED